MLKNVKALVFYKHFLDFVLLVNEFELIDCDLSEILPILLLDIDDLILVKRFLPKYVFSQFSGNMVAFSFIFGVDHSNHKFVTVGDIALEHSLKLLLCLR